MQAGDYAGAGRAYKEALAGLDAEQASLPEVERRARLEAEDVRSAVMNAHYNLACISALASVGQARPDGAVQAIAAPEAARLRDRAFEELGRAVDFKWSDAAHLEADADLAPLRDDPRWPALIERVRRRGGR